MDKEEWRELKSEIFRAGVKALIVEYEIKILVLQNRLEALRKELESPKE